MAHTDTTRTKPESSKQDVLLIADERAHFDLSGWLRARPLRNRLPRVPSHFLNFGLASTSKTTRPAPGVEAVGCRRSFAAWKSCRWTLPSHGSTRGFGRICDRPPAKPEERLKAAQSCGRRARRRLPRNPRLRLSLPATCLRAPHRQRHEWGESRTEGQRSFSGASSPRPSPPSCVRRRGS